MGKKNYYVVKQGMKVGIFTNWTECLASVKGYKGAVYKGFETKAEALNWQKGEEMDASIANENCMEAELNNTKHLFDFDAYTDGSYINGKYSYAYVFVKDKVVFYEGSGVGEDTDSAKMRNVAGEIAAVHHAVEKAIMLDVRIRIFHDYSGISLWVTGDWQAKNKYTQAYVAFMKEHRRLFEFQKVTGHSGDQFNDYVDRLAKEALGIRTK